MQHKARKQADKTRSHARKCEINIKAMLSIKNFAMMHPRRINMVNWLENSTAFFGILFYAYSCFRIKCVNFVISILFSNAILGRVRFQNFLGEYPHTSRHATRCSRRVAVIIHVDVVSRSANPSRSAPHMPEVN